MTNRIYTATTITTYTVCPIVDTQRSAFPEATQGMTHQIENADCFRVSWVNGDGPEAVKEALADSVYDGFDFGLTW